MLTLSQNGRDRLVVLHQLQQHQLSLTEGARRLGVGLRHARRFLRRFEREGDAVVVHGLRGRASNRRLDDGLRERALAKAGEERYEDFGPTLLSEHLARDPAIGLVHHSTLRLWMVEAELWKPAERGKRHRKRRERRSALGELVLMDTSEHDWLEGRSPDKLVLIAMIDDATSRLFCRFFPKDTGAANRRLIIDYLQSFGRMGALYTDQAGHFGNSRRTNRRDTTLEEREAEATMSVIRRGLDALGIELILALSPQAKGRVERLFGTLQDRLIKEMRIAGICSLQDANRFLEEEFIPFWQGRFTVEPVLPADAHRPLPQDADLLALFAETEQRVIRADFTFRYKNVHYQIEKPEAKPSMPKSRITIEERLDGTRCFVWKGRYLPTTALPAAPEPRKPDPKPRRIPAPRPVPADHPWRKKPFLVGKGVRRPPQVVASAALRPDTPVERRVVAHSH